MAERSKGGKSASAATSSRRTRPSASSRTTSSEGSSFACAMTISRASSTGIKCGRLRGHIRMFRPGGLPLLPTVGFDRDAVVLIDQRRLPDEEVYLRCRDHKEVARAIKDMAIRGAPAIGVAAAYGLALGVSLAKGEGDGLLAEFEEMAAELGATRPTAVNLFWAIARMRRRLLALLSEGGQVLRSGLLREAEAIDQEDVLSCQ